MTTLTQPAPEKKKRSSSPTIIMLIIVLIAMSLTYILPSGHLERDGK